MAQAARFFVQTKAPVSAGKMKKRRASCNPEYTGPGFTGIFETAAAAWEHAPAFVATINGDRPPSKRLQEISTPPKSAKNAPVSLSEVLKRKRATQMATAVGTRRDALHSELTKVSRAAAGVSRDLAEGLSSHLKAGTNVQRAAEMVATFARQERVTIEGANKARAELKSKVKRMKRPRSKATKQLKKQERARDFLAPFVAEGKTEGLVVSADGIGLSNDGNQMVLQDLTLRRSCPGGDQGRCDALRVGRRKTVGPGGSGGGGACVNEGAGGSPGNPPVANGAILKLAPLP
jgi:hypothetical protein